MSEIEGSDGWVQSTNTQYHCELKTYTELSLHETIVLYWGRVLPGGFGPDGIGADNETLGAAERLTVAENGLYRNSQQSSSYGN